MVRPIRATLLASWVLALINAGRAVSWATGDMGRAEEVGILAIVPTQMAVTLWALAALTMMLAYRNRCARHIAVTLTAALHSSVAVSAGIAWLQTGSEVYLSTSASYAGIAALTLLITLMTDNATVLEGRPYDGQ